MSLLYASAFPEIPNSQHWYFLKIMTNRALPVKLHSCSDLSDCDQKKEKRSEAIIGRLWRNQPQFLPIPVFSIMSCLYIIMLVCSWSLSLCWISTIHTWCESRWIDVPFRYRPKRPPPTLLRWAKGLLQKRAHRGVFSVLKGLLCPLDSRGVLCYVSNPVDVSFITHTHRMHFLFFFPLFWQHK